MKDNTNKHNDGNFYYHIPMILNVQILLAVAICFRHAMAVTFVKRFFFHRDQNLPWAHIRK